MDKKKFVVACGGTGGHSFPGLAVAAELAARGHEVTVWTSGRAIEGSVMKGWSGPVFATGAKPLAPRFTPANLRALWRSWREMRRDPPDAVLAMGSYASLPPVAAAVLRRVPVVLHEANTVPGRAVDFLAHFATAVAISFAETAERLRGLKCELTGLPVRREIVGCERFAEVPPDAFCVFVTGGSQGAHRVNELVVEALSYVQAGFKKLGRKLYVIHQTGAADEGWVMGRYAASALPSRVNAFEREMGRAFATADLVIARAGASTCFELALTGKPAFLIPLPTALRDHQHRNASSFVAAGAAAEGLQDELTARALANWILKRASDPASLEEMSAKMKALSQPDAAANVANLMERVVDPAGLEPATK